MAVAVAIRRALAALERQLPELSGHLAASVHTGAFCRYDPDPSASLRVTT